jgi:NADPH:quinone reductase
MRAVVVERFGGPEVLVPAEVPDPVPGPGQVVVDVAVADTLFVEAVIRAGGARDYFDVSPPYVPGGAVAGRVHAVADGVDTGWIGGRSPPARSTSVGTPSGLSPRLAR